MGEAEREAEERVYPVQLRAQELRGQERGGDGVGADCGDGVQEVRV